MLICWVFAFLGSLLLLDIPEGTDRFAILGDWVKLVRWVPDFRLLNCCLMCCFSTLGSIGRTSRASLHSASVFLVVLGCSALVDLLERVGVFWGMWLW